MGNTMVIRPFNDFLTINVGKLMKQCADNTQNVQSRFNRNNIYLF
jgi:hypothetical protein